MICDLQLQTYDEWESFIGNGPLCTTNVTSASISSIVNLDPIDDNNDQMLEFKKCKYDDQPSSDNVHTLILIGRNQKPCKEIGCLPVVSMRRDRANSRKSKIIPRRRYINFEYDRAIFVKDSSEYYARIYIVNSGGVKQYLCDKLFRIEKKQIARIDVTHDIDAELFKRQEVPKFVIEICSLSHRVIASTPFLISWYKYKNLTL